MDRNNRLFRVMVILAQSKFGIKVDSMHLFELTASFCRNDIAQQLLNERFIVKDSLVTENKDLIVSR